MRNYLTPQMAQKPHRITGIPQTLSLWFCVAGILWFCGVWFCGVAVHAETLRDPFTFGPRGGTVTAEELVLIGVLWDAAHPLAILGDTTVRIGDRIMDWQIVEIQTDRIVIQRDGRREIVAIGKSIPTP